MTSPHADILFFGMEDWYAMRQRSSHLAMQLAKSHRVIYINPCYYSAFGFVRDHLRKRTFRRRVWDIETINSSLSVVSFPPLFPKGEVYPQLGRLNYRLLLPLMRATFRKLKVENPVLWLTTPPSQILIGKLDERLSVYDCMDRHEFFFQGISRQLVAEEERRLFKRADLVFASSAMLVEHSSRYNSNVHLVRNGVELNMLTPKPGASELETLSDVTSAIVGYVGTIGAWLDLDLLMSVCQAYPEVTFVFIGPIKTGITTLEQLPNVRLLGQRPYAEIAQYIQRFDVCLIPFQINALTRAVDPLKLYEYLAIGKPIISTALPELESYADLIQIASSEAEFLEAVALALKQAQQPNAARTLGRQAAARQNTWEQRAFEIEQILADELHDDAISRDQRKK